MHIPDGFLDPKVSAGMIGAAAIVLGFCFSKVKAAVTAVVPQHALAVAGRGMSNVVGGMRRVLTGDGEQMIYKMGMVAALVFAGQMFNFPISSGTSGHLIGGVFSSVILGPFAGAIVIAAVLAVQMLIFADGGLLAIGANIINMALFGTIVAYCIYYYLKKIVPEWLAILAAAWAAVPLAAFACALELGLSGTIPFEQVIPAMVNVHMVIGIAEALITLALINIFRLMLKGEG
jgi:cobalamin biosynthesis protein CbiM